jgi:hypothetical protein
MGNFVGCWGRGQLLVEGQGDDDRIYKIPHVALIAEEGGSQKKNL